MMLRYIEILQKAKFIFPQGKSMTLILCSIGFENTLSSTKQEPK